MIVLRFLIFVLGLVTVASTLASAIRTFVLPRSIPDRISRLVFISLRRIFELLLLRARTFSAIDRVMAHYAPYSLLALPPVWLTLVLLGYMGMFWALGAPTWYIAFRLSGSSLLTLGFEATDGVVKTILAFSEAAIGLILVALLIAYLPTMYAAFSKREANVTLLEVRAGSPPSAVVMFERYTRLKRLDKLNELWVSWELWFVELEESHTSLAALSFFRSPQAEHSWVTAAGAVLDAASIANSTLDIPRDVQADMCIRAGYLALRRISDFFRIRYDADPKPEDPISITRDEFDAACDRMASSGVPLRADREQAWHDFRGWRVNYDTVLLALADLTLAPYAPWSSDRSLRKQRTFISRRIF